MTIHAYEAIELIDAAYIADTYKVLLTIIKGNINGYKSTYDTSTIHTLIKLLDY